jgi:hypothetical protein
MVVRKRQPFRVAHQGRQDDAGIEQTVAAGAQHGLVDVGMHHATGLANLAGKRQRQVARSAGDVEHPLTLLHVGHSDGVGLPQPMQAHRHEVVHDVISGGHGVEHPAHMPGFLAFVDRLETEMRRTHGMNASDEGPATGF